jgi:hypothetical protein
LRADHIGAGGIGSGDGIGAWRATGIRPVWASAMLDRLASRSPSGMTAAGASGSPARRARLTRPLAVRVGWGGASSGPRATCCRGVVGAAGGCRSRPDHGELAAAAAAAASGAGRSTGAGAGAGAGGGGAACRLGAPLPTAGVPWGGLIGSATGWSAVSSVCGISMVAVTPLPGELSRWTWMSCRAARLPAT